MDTKKKAREYLASQMDKHGGCQTTESLVAIESAIIDYEAEVARLRAEVEEREKAINVWRGRTQRAEAEVEGLRKVLAPFAEYERVRSTMGGTSPKSGQLLGVHSSAGSAELSVEDFKAAIAAMGASA